ncbi:MAG: hypothetical protein JXB39_13050 [Deltaproteobacteria bacterium]|nr:hypothetical protein [Deltaproteobacteria bacterium]
MRLLPLLLVPGCWLDSDVWDPPDDTGLFEMGDAVRILFPSDGDVAENPVTFRYLTTEEAVTVAFSCEGWGLQETPIPVEAGSHAFTYDFLGANRTRTVVLEGHDAEGRIVARDTVAFIPDEGWLPPETGFNRYVVEAINDTSLYPKDGTWPYCWSHDGDDCGAAWGMIWGGAYLGMDLFPGGGDCFCSGHTLEIFLDAYERWQGQNDAPIDDPYGMLTVDDVDVGVFYQWWQGFGAGDFASAAQAFEVTGIGVLLQPDEWDTAVTGDFVNLSRSTGSGHSVILVDWVWQRDRIVGLRYYSCNGSGDSHPDPDDPDIQYEVSGPSFRTEWFEGYGGTVLPAYLFVGHPWDPADLR